MTSKQAIEREAVKHCGHSFKFVKDTNVKQYSDRVEINIRYSLDLPELPFLLRS